MRIRTTVIAGFALLLGLVGIEVVVEYRQALFAKRDLAVFENSSLPESMAAADLLSIGTALEFTLIRVDEPGLTEADIKLTKDFSSALQRALKATSNGVELAREQGADGRLNEESEELEMLKRVESEFAAMEASWLSMGETALTSEQRKQHHRQALSHLQRGVQPLLKRYQDNSFAELLSHSRGNMDRTGEAFLLLLITGLIAFVATAFAGYWLVRSVMKPLQDAVDVARDIAGGNHERRMCVAGKNEFSELVGAFNNMLDRLDDTARSRDELRLLADARLGELDDFFNLSQGVLGIADYKGYFLRINPAFAELLGYSVEEILKRPILELIHSDDRKATEAEIARLARGEITCDFENRYLCSDGSWKCISWRVTPRLQSSLMYAVGRDVTGQKATESKLYDSQVSLCELNDRLERLVAERTSGLHDSEERFRMLVENVKDYAIFLLDPDGRIASWNIGAERIKGYKADEVIGKHISKFYSEEDIARGKPMYGLHLAKSRGSFEETSWRVAKGGKRFLAHVVINAIRDEDGNLKGFAKITRDITELQKNSEELQRQQELLRSLMENLGEGVVACDATGKLTFFNKAARAWHGTDITLVPTERWSESFDLYAPDGTTLLEMEDIPLVRAATGEQVRNAEMIIARKDSPLRYILASGDPLLDGNGSMIGAVVIMRDITTRRNAELNNLRTQRMESLGTLSGGIAHDLNNALAPILMGIELLRMRYPDSASIIDGMERSGKRGAGMVKQLLTFAKGVDGDRVALRPERILSEMESIVERTFPKNIETKMSTAADIRPVLGDATQIHQVLLNLCVNARDAMPDGGTLSIDAENLDVDAIYASGIPGLKPGKYVCIRIRDTGEGMPPGVVEHIFDPFFSTKSADKGTGLGLSTVIGIIRSHQGSVQVSSTPGVGTTFTVLLPVADMKAIDSRPPFVPADDFSGAGRLILVVDDEPAVREIARSVLMTLDFRVITAGDGAQGLREVEAHAAELALIISDRHMPKMDGMVFIEKARELLPQIPVILSSGRLESEDAAKLDHVGIRAFLHKPFTQTVLVEALQSVLRQGASYPFRQQ